MKKPYVFKSKYNQRIDRENKLADLSSKVAMIMLFFMFPLCYFGSFIIPAEVMVLLAFYYIACMYFILQQEFDMVKYAVGIILWTAACSSISWILSQGDSSTRSPIGEFFGALAVVPIVLLIFLPLIGALFGAFKKGQGQNYIDHGDDGGGGE